MGMMILVGGREGEELGKKGATERGGKRLGKLAISFMLNQKYMTISFIRTINFSDRRMWCTSLAGEAVPFSCYLGLYISLHFS